MSTDLFAPYQLGPFTLQNRFVMAPMTRNRAGEGTAPTALNAEYYAQRAGAGLIITEGTQPSAVGQGYPNTPGLHTDAQVAGWRLVADAVHARGGVVFAQLMHAGRIGHTSITGQRSVAPSPVTTAGEVFTPEGMQPFEEPRELATDELPGVVGEFVDAARRAREAGLDGVELHAANGYLLHQFLADNTNVRTDAYGGSPANRARFVVEVATAVAEAIGAERVGIRVSPGGVFNDIAETETEATYAALVEGLDPLRLAYLHITEGPETSFGEAIAKQFTGVVIASTGFTGASTLEAAQHAVDSGHGDLFAIGRDFLANPDLVERLRVGAPLNEQRQDLFYGGGAEGYTDYPRLSA
ncbi:alkene reductase [Geodermatophilus sp. DSM 44513]|uniref:alkene reductase n=1 Tax=Geodermatophilus sp. DSM 44513 TaxID=1528104 RepID=UPI00127A38AF|nr:alkene reductase [Geodermatophilus sp. DSM 44513]WNV77800.1 alkene reductase [Geodermatophilus sp. DSM 44513]